MRTFKQNTALSVIQDQFPLQGEIEEKRNLVKTLSLAWLVAQKNYKGAKNNLSTDARRRHLRHDQLQLHSIDRHLNSAESVDAAYKLFCDLLVNTLYSSVIEDAQKHSPFAPPPTAQALATTFSERLVNCFSLHHGTKLGRYALFKANATQQHTPSIVPCAPNNA